MLKRLLLFAAVVAFAGGSSAAGGAADVHAAQVMSGESALANGDLDGALRAFERAGAMRHSADSELGLVRAYMQGGEFRRALAFVAHTSAAHRDTPEAAALHAWLLFIGGQQAEAIKRLADVPAGTVVTRVRRELESGKPSASGPLLEAPARFAPYDSAGRVRGASVAGTGWLMAEGERAIVPAASVRGATRIWVRNGLGEAANARVESKIAGGRAVVLRLAQALPQSRRELAPRDPFPGSAAYAVEYVESREDAPGWPLLRGGFIGAATDDGGRSLGIEMPAGPRGGPVLDGAGRIVGLAMPGDVLLPASQLRTVAAPMALKPAAQVALQRVPVDVLFESAMRDTLQVLVAR